MTGNGVSSFEQFFVVGGQSSRKGYLRQNHMGVRRFKPGHTKHFDHESTKIVLAESFPHLLGYQQQFTIGDIILQFSPVGQFDPIFFRPVEHLVKEPRPIWKPCALRKPCSDEHDAISINYLFH